MDPQVRTKGNNRSSNPHKNNQKYNKKFQNPQSNFNYTQNNFNQKRGPVPREIYSKPAYNPSKNNHSNPWTVFNGNRLGNKPSHNQIIEKFDMYQSQHNYAKMSKGGYNKGYYSDMNYNKSTNASSNSDNEGMDVFSELNGFTIVQNGKTIFNEEDKIRAKNDEFILSQLAQAKFASSLMMVGPSAKEISIPVFAEVEQIC
jgi:hypothetical protein